MQIFSWHYHYNYHTATLKQGLFHPTCKYKWKTSKSKTQLKPLFDNTAMNTEFYSIKK